MADPYVVQYDPAVVRRKNRANAVNGSTALGLLVARLGRCRVTRGPRGMWLADGYKFKFPVAGAFTVGSVAITSQKWPEILADREWLFRHEEHHSFQYAACWGLPFLPAYAVAMLWSKLLTGDLWSRNYFEQHAGLAIGGYTEHQLRAPFRLASGLRRR